MISELVKIRSVAHTLAEWYVGVHKKPHTEKHLFTRLIFCFFFRTFFCSIAHYKIFLCFLNAA